MWPLSLWYFSGMFLMLEPLQLVIGYNSLDLIGGFPKNISWTIVLTSPFLATKVKKRTTLHPIGDSKVFPFGNEAQSHLGILQYLCLQFRLHRLRQNLPHSGQMLKPYQNWRLWKDQTHQAVWGVLSMVETSHLREITSKMLLKCWEHLQ